jgi:PAS domain-containing protein
VVGADAKASKQSESTFSFLTLRTPHFISRIFLCARAAVMVALRRRDCDRPQPLDSIFDAPAKSHSVWIFDRTSHVFLRVNDAAVRQYGYSRQEFL